MAITKKRIYKHVAKEMLVRNETNSDLKKDGCIIELWSAKDAVSQVRRHMKSLKS